MASLNIQGQQGSGPDRYPEQGLQASPTASGIPTGPDFQRDPHHASLPYSVEARSIDLYTVVPRREYFILFHFILIIPYMLLAL